MEKYIAQLLADIAYATENISWPFVEREVDIHDWISPEEEARTAPVRELEEWTGIRKEELPPQEMLSDDQVLRLLNALKKLLDACNWSFVLQTAVPERIQYAAIRDNFNQQAKIKRWHCGFFELCRPGTEHGQCALGEYCQCAFYAELFAGFVDDELSPEEEQAIDLEMEIKHLKQKYGDDWKKYHPFYLDPDNSDESANPDENDEDDDLWS
jgi:hypothetical protein